MVGTLAVTIGLQEALGAELQRLEAPDDLISDLQVETDKLLRLVATGRSDKDGKLAVRQQLQAVVDTFAVGVGVSWEAQLRREISLHGDAS